MRLSATLGLVIDCVREAEFRCHGATIPRLPGIARLFVQVGPIRGLHSVSRDHEYLQKVMAPPDCGNEAGHSRCVSLHDLASW